jgi:hypothetical protein
MSLEEVRIFSPSPADSRATAGSPAVPPAPFALLPVAAVALATLALELSALTRYGWFRDELYYLSCARRLAWGYVDHPPFSVAVIAGVRAVLGESLPAIRLVPALAGAGIVIALAMLARRLGGGRFAQVATALAGASAPLVLGAAHIASMNVFDLGFWTLGTLLFLRACERPSLGRWTALGLALGLGLLDKWSVLWLGVGLALSLVLTWRRRLLATRGPWIAAGLALALFAPNLLWQSAHGWPTLEFMHNAGAGKMRAIAPLPLVLGQALELGLFGFALWILGLALSLRRDVARPMAVVYLFTLAVLVAQGHARTEYLVLAALPLLAAGAVQLEAAPRTLRLAVATVGVLLALPLVPFAVPLLPVRWFIAYQARLGVAPRTEERHRMGALPQYYADMFGWPEFADSVARAADRLPPAERARAIVVVDNYGEAGALEKFGRGRVPTIACQHNNWYLWGPPAWDGRVALIVGRDSADVAGEFGHVERAGTAGHPLAMPYEQDLPIWVARDFHADLATAWKQGKNYN